MRSLFIRFVQEEDGQDIVEYALMVVFVAFLAAVGLQAFGQGLDQYYDDILTTLQGAGPALPGGGGGG
jgi:Flp pilus assembly pilin Flp